MSAIIESLEPGSIGEEIGLEPGDALFSINGNKPRDLIDYRFLIGDEYICLKIIDKKGEFHEVSFEKEVDATLGITFTEALFDNLKQCNNQCPFCFIDQQPTGHRKSLYLKDDDYRLSFLYGSYLTLTNLTDADWHRIEEQRLSPLFVSVHATNPELRSRLLKNPNAKFLLNQLTWFKKRKLQIHAQVVVCPGLNDGNNLETTLLDLAKFAKGEWATVISTAVVPVGLTRFRPKNDGLRPVTPQGAKKIIKQVEYIQTQFKVQLGTRFVWLSDEWYLIAGMPLPPRNEYEELPQEENGVGSIRAFLESIDQATKNLPKAIKAKKTCSWIVGKLVKEALSSACKRLNNVEGLQINLLGLPSPYWGQDQVVTGLLTGEDLVKGLADVALGDQILLPSVMLKEGSKVFLDDMSLEELQLNLKKPIRIVHGADDIVAAALEDAPKIH